MEEKQKKDVKETKAKPKVEAAKVAKPKKVIKKETTKTAKPEIKVEKEVKAESKPTFAKVSNEEKRPEVKVEAKTEKKKSKSKVGSVIKTIFLFALLLLAIFIVCTFLQWNLVCKIYDANTQIDLGNNYKLTTEYGGENASTSVKIYKDGISVYQLGETGFIWTDNQKTYIILTSEKQYFGIENGTPMTDVNSTTVPTYEIFADKDKVALLQEVLLGKIQIKTEEFEGQDCYIVTSENEKVWANKDSLQIIRDESNGEIVETKIEKDVVTDQDIALPDLTKYTRLH